MLHLPDKPWSLKARDSLCFVQSLWRPLLIVWVLWCVFLFLATFANLYDLRHAGSHITFQTQLIKFLAILLPWPVLSSGLLIYFAAKNANKGIAWSQIVRLVLFLVLVFLPLHVVYEHAFFVAYIRRQALNWEAIVQALSPLQIWVDVMVLLFILSAHLALQYWQHGRQQLHIASQSQQEVLRLKLLYLRTHLEPYFLLSSLEGIENLVVNADTPMATRALARMSDLLRYVLESAQETNISVESEIRFLRDYLDLQNLACANCLQLQWEFDGHDWSAIQIPPLLLYPLFDYAVRHRQVTSKDQASPMLVRIALEQSMLCVSIDFNAASPILSSTEELEAARQRIALLHADVAAIDLMTQAAPTRLSHRIRLIYPITELDDA